MIETMAEYIEKPLFSISLAQLSDEEQIDERLQKILDYSVSLGGVLLLDEADVVLEARSYENLRRNALVSGTLPRAFFDLHLIWNWPLEMRLNQAWQSVSPNVGILPRHLVPNFESNEVHRRRFPVPDLHWGEVRPHVT